MGEYYKLGVRSAKCRMAEKDPKILTGANREAQEVLIMDFRNGEKGF